MNTNKLKEKFYYLIKESKKSGADNVDVIYVQSTNIDIGCRLKKIEKLERSESSDLGLRYLKNKKQVILSTNDLNKKSLDQLIEKASAMVKAVPQNPYCEIAKKNEIIKKVPNLEIYDPKKQVSVP